MMIFYMDFEGCPVFRQTQKKGWTIEEICACQMPLICLWREVNVGTSTPNPWKNVLKTMP
jgi:hypothetical protein